MQLQPGVGKFYRVKSGQSQREVEKFLSCPANGCFAGAVIPVSCCAVHTVRPFETYFILSQQYGVEEETLKQFNGNRPCCPSNKIYIPSRGKSPLSG